VLRQLDWDKLGSIIGDDWANMPHETEVLLGALYLGPATRYLVQNLIVDRTDRIVHFPPRLMLMVPEVGLAHLAKGGSLRLAKYTHVSWDVGGIALAIIAEKRSELVEQAVAPFIDTIAGGVTNYNRDFSGPVEGLLRVVIEHAPGAWRKILAGLDLDVAERNLAEWLTRGETHRRAAAVVIESAATWSGPVGDMAQRLRVRFPKSTVPAAEPRFLERRGRSRPKPKG
jgi:hypothetical protein